MGSNTLAAVITWSLASFTSRLFTALGISLTTYSALDNIVDRLLDTIQPTLNQLPNDVLYIMGLTGIGDGLTMIASALATRAAFVSARVYITSTTITP